MKIIASRDQFKPIRIEENLALNYNFAYFYSIVERADRIARELDASSKQENGTDSPFQLSCTNRISWIFFNTVDNCNDIKTIETCFSAMMIVNAVGAILMFSGSIIGCMGTCCAKETVSHASKRPMSCRLPRFLRNGNKTEWNPIRSVIIWVITKSDDRVAGVRFVYHEYDYRPNWMTRSPITN